MKPANITIEDVATAAGVSRQTVSRVINSQPNVRAAVRERVKATIAELGYVPNLAARRMAGARSYLILAAFEKNAVGREMGRLPLDTMMLAGMRICSEHGYNLLFEEVEPGPSTAAQAANIARTLTSLKPDGVVLCPSLEENIDIRNALSEYGIPADFLGQRSEFGRMIPGLDDGAFGEAAAEHLLSRGHRQIGFLSGLHDKVRSGRRLAGYRRAMVKVGSRAQGHFMSDVPLKFDQALELARTWLTPTIRPTGIIAETQESALAVLGAARALAIDVPADLSVLVLDDQPSLALANPAITVLHQDYAEHFAAACKRMMETGSKPAEHSAAAASNDGFTLIERASVTSAPRAR